MEVAAAGNDCPVHRGLLPRSRVALVAAHQIDHLPWLGYFLRMQTVDVFVELDCVQYNHGRFQNRNRIVDSRGRAHWLRVPVRDGKRHRRRMLDVEIADQPWQRRYLETVRHSYHEHPHFERVFEPLADVIDRPWRRLIDLNRALRSLLASVLGVRAPLRSQSELGLEAERGESLLIGIAEALGADRFLSGPTGRVFLDRMRFAEAGLALAFAPPFEARPYPQHESATFAPNLSALDLAMNLGPAAGTWLREAHGLV